MHKTQFAGLTAPDANDPPLSVDGGSFATENPEITDHFLRIGAVDHRHDEHPALADPVVAASAVIDTTGGTIGPGRDLYVGYTLVDRYGGETRISPVVNMTTPPPLDAATTPFDAVFDDSAGTLPVGSYYYGLTLLDETGGETTMGPTILVLRPPGTPTGQVTFTGLAADLGPDLGASWRLWRADNGGVFNIIAAGTDDTFTDDGIDPVDHAATPPTSSRNTRSTNMLTVTIPDSTAEPGFVEGQASAFVLYLSDDGAFSNPSMYDLYPAASAGTTVVITDATVVTGAPPDVSRSIPGAHKITAAELAGGGGGGGGGLFAYPQDYTANLNSTGALSTEQSEVFALARDDNTLTAFRRGKTSDSYGSVAGFTDHVGNDASFVYDNYRVALYDEAAPGMKDGTVTVQFRFASIDDLDVLELSALIGSPSGPATRAELSIGSWGWSLDATVGDYFEGSNETIANAGDATAPVIDTDYWLRITRDGSVVTAEFFDVDPTTVGATPLGTATADTADFYYSRRWDWALLRQQSQPGFGWFIGDSQMRGDIVQIYGLTAHAESGGEGYPGMMPPRLVIQDHNSDVQPRHTLNFAGELSTSDEQEYDRFTVRIGFDNVAFEPFNYDGGYAGYSSKRGIVDWHATGSVAAASAGSDGRIMGNYGMSEISQKAMLRVVAIEPDDIAGVMLMALDLDNFLIAQVNNDATTPALEIAYASAGVLTPLASAAIPAAVPGWRLIFELGSNFNSDLTMAAAIVPIDPSFSFASPIAQVEAQPIPYTDPIYEAFRHVIGDPANVAGSVGLRILPAVGGGNTMRLTDWLHFTA